jgi:hypothetical protein
MSDDTILFIDGVGERDGHSFATKTAVLPNGAKITKLNAAGPIVMFNFLYEDKEFQFHFLASRWGQDVRPSDTWLVNFRSELTQAPGALKSILNDAALEIIAGNIRKALLAWPPAKQRRRSRSRTLFLG